MMSEENFTLKNFVPRYSFYPLYSAWPKEIMTESKSLIKTTYYQEMESAKDILIYIHIPYCQELCNFCGLNVKITKSKDEINSFVDHLIKEIKNSPRCSNVKGVSIGGGTPNFLPAKELERLIVFLHQHFNLSSEAHLQIEIDPRYITLDQLNIFQKFNFKNLIVGLIDFNSDVLALSNRHQGPNQAAGLELILNQNYFSVTAEIIAGLAMQSKESIKFTLDYCLNSGVNSFNIYPLFIAPWNPNSKIHIQITQNNKSANFSDNRFELFKFACDYLKSHHITSVGPGHFATPDHWWNDKLQKEDLCYCISGVFPFIVDHMLSFGPSAISSSSSIVCANEKVTDRYLSLIQKKEDCHSSFFVKSKSQIAFQELINQLFAKSQTKIPSEILENPSFLINKKIIVELELAKIEDQSIKMTSLGREYFGHLLHLLDPKI